MNVLAVNSGSSSLKFKLVRVGESRRLVERPFGESLLSGAVDDIGRRAALTVSAGARRTEMHRSVDSHGEAAQWMLEHLRSRREHGEDSLPIDAVGHRVVHGGEAFRETVQIDARVESRIEALSELAPLHNPACLAGIRGVRAALGAEVPMVAVFDTAFHRTMPAWASSYAIPRDLADRHHVRRYGFHGIAHASVAAQFASGRGRSVEELRLITVHLGNGCSVTAVRHGRSIDTSMGFTPLEGLVMGTRCGDLDPSVVGYLVEREGVAVREVEDWLNHRSGLLGVSGISRDMREVLAAARENHPGASLAVALFCYRAKKYLGAYLAALGGADAVLFSGGIGEHAPSVRARICEDMGWCGLKLDEGRNAAVTSAPAGEAVPISEDGSALPAYVLQVDEEGWIARETARCLAAGSRTEF